MELIPDGTAVNVTGFVDLDTNEPAEDQRGVIVSGGHTVDDVPHYDVHLDGAPFPVLIAADRITAE